MRISDWSSDVCSSDLIFGTAELRVHNTVEREFSDNRCHEIFKRMARDDMLAARAELSAGRIFEHFPIHGENVERDLGPGEIWHHDNIVDWTEQLLIATSGAILFGTNRSEERSVGKEWGMTEIMRWTANNKKKKKRKED